MPSDVTLTSALRNNLQSLQKTKGSSTAGNEAMEIPPGVDAVVKAAQDFCTQTLSSHASELTSQMEDISGSIKTLEQESQDISEILSLVTNAELIALAAQSAIDADENADTGKFEKTIETVIDNAQEVIQKSGIFAEEPGLENVSLASPYSIASSIEIIRDAIDEAQGLKTTIANEFDEIQTRQDFTLGTISALETGQKEINITSLSEEGANLMALQTRIALGEETSLSLASPTQEELLRLF